MFRIQIVFSLICGIVIVILAPTSQANDRCYDHSLKLIDRLSIRIETGTNLSAQEIKCRKLESFRARQTVLDDRYLAEQVSDDLFRKDSGAEKVLSNNSGPMKTSDALTISEFATQEDKSEKQPIDTLKGFKSVTDEP